MPKKKKYDRVFTWKPFLIHDPRQDVSDPCTAYRSEPLNETSAQFSEMLEYYSASLASGNNRRIAYAMRAIAIKSIEWLSDASHAGNEVAQNGLISTGFRAGEACLLAMQHKLPEVVKRAEMSTCMPGLISNIPELQAQGAKICEGVKLGRRTKFQSRGLKKAQVGLSTPMNVLVLNLIDYVQKIRDTGEAIGEIEEYLQTFDVDPLMVSIVRLPDLGKQAPVINAWASVCVGIIKRADNYSLDLMKEYRTDLLASIKDALRKLAK
jgi:hypothetical protein